MKKVKPWYAEVRNWVAATLGFSFLITAGIYMAKVDRLESLYDINKDITQLKENVAVLMDRSRNSSSPPLTTAPQPKAGKQR